MNAEVAIVGGGLAGAAAAITLAHAGREVVLLEAEPQPQHKVCGEFLSHEALSDLNALGVDARSLGAVAIEAVRLAGGKEHGQSAQLPFHAMSLTRRALDAELLCVAERAGVTVLRGHRVHALQRDGAGWRAALADDRCVMASSVFLATGKHDLHAHPRPQGVQPGLVAFKMYFALAPQQAAELAGHVELLLYRGGYAGLQPVENGAANLCCLVQRAALQRPGPRWTNLLDAMQRECPLLARRLSGAQALLAQPLAISAIPYGYMRRDAADGLWRLGDQAAVIPSFTGDGMSIALHSGRLAAAMYLRGDPAESFQERLHRELRPQVALATTISRGLLWPASRAVFSAAVGAWPRLLGSVARRTRISPEVLAGAV